MKVSVHFLSQIRISLTNSVSRPKIVVVRSEREIVAAIQVPLRVLNSIFRDFGRVSCEARSDEVQRMSSTTALLSERCQSSLLYLPHIIHARLPLRFAHARYIGRHSMTSPPL
jgi:hypothetical protein